MGRIAGAVVLILSDDANASTFVKNEVVIPLNTRYHTREVQLLLRSGAETTMDAYDGQVHGVSDMGKVTLAFADVEKIDCPSPGPGPTA